MGTLGSILDMMATLPFWVAVLRVATPLILGTLGVLLCERAGVLNLGIEGLMVAGAFSGWLAVWGLLRLVRTRTFGAFVAYRIVVGVGVLALVASAVR